MEGLCSPASSSTKTQQDADHLWGGGFAETLAAETDHRFSNTCLGVAEILHIFLKVHSKLFLQFFNLSRLKSSPIGCVVFVCQEMYAFS